MNKADEFLAEKGIYHDVKYPTIKSGEIWLTELLEQYAQQIAIEFAIWNMEGPDFEDEEVESHYKAVYKNWYTNHQNQENG